MFQLDQWVIYGVHGVCRVVGKEKQRVNRNTVEYLVLEPWEQSEARYYVPTANESVMGRLRPVLTAEEMEALLSSDEIREDCWIADENQRKQYYRDLVAAGDRVSILKMTAALYRHKESRATAGRKFHQCDDNFLRDAEKLLAQEIALVLGKTAEDAQKYLRDILGQ